jgi:small-conductance mechanosensitive channel
VLVGQFFLFKFTNWLFRKLKLRIQKLKDTKLKPISIQDYELLDTQKQVNLLVFVANLVRYVVMLLQLLLTVPLLFSIFPQTKSLAYTLFSYIWNPIKVILNGIADYIPNLFTIFVICYAVKYLVRLVRYLANEVQAERLKINGFYPDWAIPTYHIVRFLLYAFMIAMIYPYLPGSKSGVFQGISVFVGLIVSLGSSTVIGNIIAGLVITYMRPFKLGDRIKQEAHNMIGRNGPIRIEAVYLQPFSLHLIGKITHQSDQILHRIAYHKDSEQIGYIVGYSIQDDLYRIPDVGE